MNTCALILVVMTVASSMFLAYLSTQMPIGNPLKTKKPVAAGHATMKAWQYKAYGKTSDVLERTDSKPIPLLGSKEVMVEIRAVALNPIDYKRINTYTEAVLDSWFLDIESDGIIPVFDFAGVVTNVGEDCTRIKEGDEVYGMQVFFKDGTLAEYQAVPEMLVSLKPKSLTFEEAASIPLAGLTSYQALRAGNIKKGAKVVILGGSGGTGSMAVQIAKASKASQIVVTAGERNVELMKQLGATAVLDYKKQDWFRELDGAKFDIVLDCVGGYASYAESHRVLPQSGKYVTIAGDKQAPLNLKRVLQTGVIIFTRKVKHLTRGAPDYQFIVTQSHHTDLDALSNLIDRQLLKPVIDSTFAFDDALAAFEHLEAGHVVGKVVIKIRD